MITNKHYCAGEEQNTLLSEDEFCNYAAQIRNKLGMFLCLRIFQRWLESPADISTKVLVYSFVKKNLCTKNNLWLSSVTLWLEGTVLFCLFFFLNETYRKQNKLHICLYSCSPSTWCLSQLFRFRYAWTSYFLCWFPSHVYQIQIRQRSACSNIKPGSDYCRPPVNWTCFNL